MSKLIDTQVDAAGDLVLTRNDVEVARVDTTGTVTTRGGSMSVVGQNVKLANPSSTVERFVPTGPIKRLHTLFAPLVCDIAVGLRPNGTDYELLYGFGSARYWRCLLALESGNPGSFPLHQIQDHAEVTPMVSVDGADASVTRGAGVTGPTVQAGAFGGHYWFGSAAAQTFTIAVPSSTRIGIRQPLVVNGGLARVSIDADFTKANLLPTAQAVVNSGAYPNTILVANGGTCNPTDRVLDSYNPNSITVNPDVPIAIADGLTAATHTVVLTPVGVARSVGAGTRVYFSGYGYAVDGTTSLATSGAVTYSNVGLLSPLQASAWEYALKTGGTFFGNVHGYDVEDSISVTVDGLPQTLTTGQIVGATDYLEVTRQSHLVNPGNTAQTIATVTTVYHLDRDGLRVDNTITWQASLTIQAAYVMAALNGVAWGTGGHMSQADTIFNQGSLVTNSFGPFTFTGVGDTYFPQAGVKSEAAWIYGGNYGLLMWMPNVSGWTNNWTNSGFFARIEDRGTNPLFVTKMYIPRIWDTFGTENVVSGNVWTSTTLYLMGRFPSGAAASVAA